MKKLITITIFGFLSFTSMNALAASKYQIKAGSWLDAYVSKKNCGKSDCTMVSLPRCSGGPDNVYLTQKNAIAVEKSINNGSTVKVYDRTQNAEVCSI
tara:strand:+ start:1625 stop:1918 length:294 start_codon:yes stop_codon:yes gene_type:complete